MPPFAFAVAISAPAAAGRDIAESALGRSIEVSSIPSMVIGGVQDPGLLRQVAGMHPPVAEERRPGPVGAPFTNDDVRSSGIGPLGPGILNRGHPERFVASEGGAEGGVERGGEPGSEGAEPDAAGAIAAACGPDVASGYGRFVPAGAPPQHSNTLEVRSIAVGTS